MFAEMDRIHESEMAEVQACREKVRNIILCHFNTIYLTNTILQLAEGVPEAAHGEIQAEIDELVSGGSFPPILTY